MKHYCPYCNGEVNPAAMMVEARMKKSTKKQRSDNAKKAAQARWNKSEKLSTVNT